MTRRAPQVLVFGSARSGTTWTAEILSSTAGTQLVHEPDAVAHADAALAALAGLDTYPALGANDAAPACERLWAALLGGRRPRRIRGRNRIARRLLQGLSQADRRAHVRPDPPPLAWRYRLGIALAQPPRVDPDRPLVVKSGAVVFALDWLLARWNPAPVWVRRHPLDVVAGRMAVGFPHAANLHWAGLERAGRVPPWCPRPPDTDGSVASSAWIAGVTMSVCRDAAGRHEDVVVVDHEALCRNPEPEFRELATRVGLEWTDHAADTLAATNQPGEGWSTNRIAADQPGRWRTRLSEEEQEIAIHWLSKFPIAADFAELV